MGPDFLQHELAADEFFEHVMLELRPHVGRDCVAAAGHLHLRALNGKIQFLARDGIGSDARHHFVRIVGGSGVRRDRGFGFLLAGHRADNDSGGE